MRRFVIDMYIRSFDIGETFQLHLKFLGDIMGGSQGLVRIHDDVDFDDDSRSGVVCSDGVDGDNHGGVGHCCFELLFCAWWREIPERGEKKARLEQKTKTYIYM